MKRILIIIIFIYQSKSFDCNDEHHKQIFGEKDEYGNKYNHLQHQDVKNPSYFAKYCPQIQSTCCSEDLSNSLVNQFKQALITTGFMEIQITELQKQLTYMYSNQNMYSQLLVIQNSNEQIQKCLSIDGEDEVNHNFQFYYDNMKNQAAKLSQVFTQLKQQMVNFYGGTLCGMCDNKYEDNLFWFKDKESQQYILMIEYSKEAKVQLLDIFKLIIELQYQLYQVIQISKVGYCNQRAANDNLDLKDFLIFEKIALNYEEILNALEHCKTNDEIQNFLNEGVTSCASVVIYFVVFNDLNVFEGFTKIYVQVMKSLKFISLQNNQEEIPTLFTDENGQQVDWNTQPQEWKFMKRKDEQLHPIDMRFVDVGINPQQENFNVKAVKTLIFENQPFSFQKLVNNFFLI